MSALPDRPPAPPAPRPSPVRKRVTVPLPPKDAFDLFTRGIARWWPDSHTASGARGGRPADISVEPRTGGRIVETTPDGRRIPWATITRWEEGRRLEADWHVGEGEDGPTELQVTFTDDGAGGTRVDLVHGGWPPGESASARRADYDADWTLVLLRLAVAVPVTA